jgi:hypothetical protein
LHVIISHEHEFIFVKTRKTAGTSIEVFLGRIAGEDAVVTPIEPTVEGHRPRNYRVPSSAVRALEWRVRHRLRPRPNAIAYFNHISAAGIRQYLGRRRWNRYFTFCFERNPWQKVLSRYYFAIGRGEFDGTLREFVLGGEHLESDFGLYSFDGKTVGVDFVGRYERLEDDLAHVLAHLGHDPSFVLTREKGNYRPRDATLQPTFDAEMSDRVEAVYAREIREFGFERPAHLIAGDERPTTS